MILGMLIRRLCRLAADIMKDDRGSITLKKNLSEANTQ